MTLLIAPLSPKDVYDKNLQQYTRRLASIIWLALSHYILGRLETSLISDLNLILDDGLFFVKGSSGFIFFVDLRVERDP